MADAPDHEHAVLVAMGRDHPGVSSATFLAQRTGIPRRKVRHDLTFLLNRGLVVLSGRTFPRSDGPGESGYRLTRAGASSIGVEFIEQAQLVTRTGTGGQRSKAKPRTGERVSDGR